MIAPILPPDQRFIVEICFETDMSFFRQCEPAIFYGRKSLRRAIETFVEENIHQKSTVFEFPGGFRVSPDVFLDERNNYWEPNIYTVDEWFRIAQNWADQQVEE